MTNLRFEVGTYKEYQLNGGESIRICVSDPNIIERIKAVDKQIDELYDKYGDEISPDEFAKVDKELRLIVDTAIDCPGACDKAFGNTNCLALAGGRPILYGFLDVLLEQLKKDIVSSTQANKIKLEEKQNELEALENERTRKYIKKSDTDRTEILKKLDLSVLSEQERSVLLEQIDGVSK